MPALVQNTPSALIPKELFSEEKIKEYGNVLFAKKQFEFTGKDDLDNFYLVYPKPKDEDTIHEISVLYNSFQEQRPQQSNAVCFNGYDDGLNILILKDMNIEYTGFFPVNVKEDIVYHLAHISQQFFDDISQINFYYQNVPLKTLPLLNQYFEMKKL